MWLTTSTGIAGKRSEKTSSQMYYKGGCSRAAAVLLLCGLTSGLSASASATSVGARVYRPLQQLSSAGQFATAAAL